VSVGWSDRDQDRDLAYATATVDAWYTSVGSGLTQPPGDRHRPVPFLRDVISRTQEHIWRRSKRVGFRLPHEKQDVGTPFPMMDGCIAAPESRRLAY
jgi:hypothetical protein